MALAAPSPMRRSRSVLVKPDLNPVEADEIRMAAGFGSEHKLTFCQENKGIRGVGGTRRSIIKISGLQLVQEKSGETKPCV